MNDQYAAEIIMEREELRAARNLWRLRACVAMGVMWVYIIAKVAI